MMMEIFSLYSAEVKDVVCGNSDMLNIFLNNLLFQKCQWTFIHENTCGVHVLGPFKLRGNDILLTQQGCKSLEYSNKISFGS